MSQGCFPSHNVYDRLAISAPATVRAGRNKFCMNVYMMIHTRIESPFVPVPTNLESTLDRETFSPSLSLSQGMHMIFFCKVYCDRVYFLCAERFETGSGFHPPAAPTTQLRGECPPGVFMDFSRSSTQVMKLSTLFTHACLKKSTKYRVLHPAHITN